MTAFLKEPLYSIEAVTEPRLISIFCIARVHWMEESVKMRSSTAWLLGPVLVMDCTSVRQGLPDSLVSHLGKGRGWWRYIHGACRR